MLIKWPRISYAIITANTNQHQGYVLHQHCYTGEGVWFEIDFEDYVDETFGLTQYN